MPAPAKRSSPMHRLVPGRSGVLARQPATGVRMLVRVGVLVALWVGMAVTVGASPAVRRTLCELPIEGLADTCGALGLGGQPTRAERLAWRARASESCPELAEFFLAHPDGVYAPTATASLRNPRWVSVTEDRRPRHQVQVAGPRDGRTRARAEPRALDRCRDNLGPQPDRVFGIPVAHRVVAGTEAHRSRPHCWDTERGQVCGSEVQVTCEVHTRTPKCGLPFR